MANGSTPFDSLSPVYPTINSLILGTGHDDVLSAQADGDLILGLAGDDHLSSAFNRTELIGGSGHDTLMTNALVALQGELPVHGLAVQSGGIGSDDLSATVTLQGGNLSVSNTELNADVILDGGSGNDVINGTANVALPVSGIVTVSTDVGGGSGNDTIDVLADGRGAFGSSIAMNTVDAGSGDDHVTAHAETEFNAYMA